MNGEHFIGAIHNVARSGWKWRECLVAMFTSVFTKIYVYFFIFFAQTAEYVIETVPKK